MSGIKYYLMRLPRSTAITHKKNQAVKATNTVPIWKDHVEDT
jgi:hypothetical protein